MRIHIIDGVEYVTFEDAAYDQVEHGRTQRDKALAQIRARRDEMSENRKNAWGQRWEIEFSKLFNDGAEFGPDKPEPKYQFTQNSDGRVNVLMDGGLLTTVPEKAFNAIKKLGAKEAKGE